MMLMVQWKPFGMLVIFIHIRPLQQAVTVTSTDIVDDSETGTGARTVTVEGLDASYNQVSETLTVGGSAGTIEFYRVFRAFVASSGSTGSNEELSSFSGGTTLTNSCCGSPTSRGLEQTFMTLYRACRLHWIYL